MNKLLPALALPFVMFAQALAGDADADLKALQGSWTVISLAEEGMQLPEKEIQALEVVIVKNVLTVTEKGKVIAQYQFTLDASATPRAIDVTHLIGKEKGMKNPGIYEVDAKALRICLDETGKLRPTAFTGDAVKKCSVIVLKRKAS